MFLGGIAGSGSYQAGGFGGGAPADAHSYCGMNAGAGGGYSGGSGFTATFNQNTGYGGGSYNGGSYQSNYANYWKGNGLVTIKYSPPGMFCVRNSQPC